jgi:hypothetical protein
MVMIQNRTTTWVSFQPASAKPAVLEPPKGDGTLDRRPLTIMRIIYRLWAARMAHFTGEWMHAYMPPAICGGRRFSCACDAV